jgi:hypothetical protein
MTLPARAVATATIRARKKLSENDFAANSHAALEAL